MPAEFTVMFPASKQTEEGVLEGSTRKTLIHQHTYVVGLYLGSNLQKRHKADSKVAKVEIACHMMHIRSETLTEKS